MTTVGRWSPNKVRARVLDGTWVSPAEELGGMVLLTPSSIAYSGTSATIGANGSVEFSACSSLSLNGVFSADYDNYMVAMWHSLAVGGDALFLRMRLSGTDNSTASSYVYQKLEAYSTTVAGSRTTSNQAVCSTSNDSQRHGLSLSMFGPYLAQPTAWRSVTVSGSAGAQINDYAGTHNQSTSYDGVTLYPGSINISGLVSVYGLVGA